MVDIETVSTAGALLTLGPAIIASGGMGGPRLVASASYAAGSVIPTGLDAYARLLHPVTLSAAI